MFFRIVIFLGMTLIVMPLANTMAVAFSTAVPWFLSGILLGILLYFVFENWFFNILDADFSDSISMYYVSYTVFTIVFGAFVLLWDYGCALYFAHLNCEVASHARVQFCVTLLTWVIGVGAELLSLQKTES